MMTVNEVRQEISHFNMADRLLLVEEIWDSIVLNQHELPVLEVQKKQLNERYRDYQAGHVRLHNWQDVHNELRAKYR